MLQRILFLALFFTFGLSFASDGEKTDKPDINQFIMDHIGDSHDYHLADWKGHAISIPLPVILLTNDGLVCFSSAEFHHDNQGKVVFEKNGQRFTKYKGQIYYANQGENLINLDENGKVLNERPWDFSITKNVVVLIMVLSILFLLFIPMANAYKKNKKAPKGMNNALEALVLFIRDEVAIPNIGKDKYQKYIPYLLTIFFLILIGNLLGLVPVISGTLTNDIVFTGTLAFATFLITNFSGNKHYWKHIFATPGVPKLLLPIMIPVEIIGLFTKPFALMVRLFANISAGHIIILSLISLIFVFETALASPVSILFGLFIMAIELLVAFLQAYIFTLLSALFIGSAVEDGHH